MVKKEEKNLYSSDDDEGGSEWDEHLNNINLEDKNEIIEVPAHIFDKLIKVLIELMDSLIN